MDLTVIVVNWNTADMTLDCVAAVRRELAMVPGELMVIDNGSETGDVSWLAERIGADAIVRNAANKGFAAAVNQGVRRARGRHVLLLNPDVLLGPGTLRHLVDYLDTNPRVGAVGPLVLDPDGSVQASVRAFPTFLSAFAGRQSLLTRYVPDNPLTRRNLPMLSAVASGPCPVDWMSGACLLLRREALEAIGELDERFFMYWEDVDVCWRLRERGWQVVHDPRVRVVHEGGASSRQAMARCTVYFHRSAYHFHRKHVTRRSLHPMNLVAAAGLTTRTLVLLAARTAARLRPSSLQGLHLNRGRTRLETTTALNAPAASGQP